MGNPTYFVTIAFPRREVVEIEVVLWLGMACRCAWGEDIEQHEIIALQSLS